MRNFQRLKSGSRWALTETTANAIMASAEEFSKRPRDPGQLESPEYAFQGNIIEVRNDSGYAMPRFSVAGLAAPLITPANNLQEFQNYVRFSVRTPTAADWSNFCVLVEPLAPGAIGLAMVSGVVPCQILRSPGDSAPAYANIVAAQIAYLKDASSGAGVLWCDNLPSYASSPQPVWAYVRIPDLTPPLATQLLSSTLVNQSTPIGSGKFTADNWGGFEYQFEGGEDLTGTTSAAVVQLLTLSSYDDPAVQINADGLYLVTSTGLLSSDGYGGSPPDPWNLTVSSNTVNAIPGLRAFFTTDVRMAVAGGGFSSWGAHANTNYNGSQQLRWFVNQATGGDGQGIVFAQEQSALYDLPAGSQIRTTATAQEIFVSGLGNEKLQGRHVLRIAKLGARQRSDY